MLFVNNFVQLRWFSSKIKLVANVSFRCVHIYKHDLTIGSEALHFVHFTSVDFVEWTAATTASNYKFPAAHV